MLTGDPALFVRHAELIYSDAVRDAYRYLVGAGALSTRYRCEARQKGVIPDVRYYDGEEQPFAFIVNRESLLWYFRKPGLRHPAADVARLRAAFVDVDTNPAGEITVRIELLTDAVQLVRLVLVDDTSKAARA